MLLGMAIGVYVWGPIGFLLGPVVFIILLDVFTIFGLDKKDDDPGETIIHSHNQNRSLAPALYVGYFDNTRSVSGDVMEGGYTLTKVHIDIYSLECDFDLTVGYPQFVQIEIVNEFGRRMGSRPGR